MRRAEISHPRLFANVQAIAGASPRLQSLHLGAADFAASMGMATTGIGGTQEGYYVLPPKDAEGARPPAFGSRRASCDWNRAPLN